MSIIKSEKVSTQRSKNNPNVINVVVEPLERGFGVTLGNSLRRVLLSSIQGAAITYVKISGVSHEFQSITGLKEDLIDLLVNLKNMVIKMSSSESQTLKLKISGPCVVTASMIEPNPLVSVVDPNHFICALEAIGSLELEMICEIGRGYVPADSSSSSNTPGVFSSSSPTEYIALDALFSPIRSVLYHVEKTRVGQVTDYDKLVMSIETNGSISPDDALSLAAKTLQEQFAMFVIGKAEEYSVDAEDAGQNPVKFHPVLLKKISSLELSVRAKNCLNGDNIVYVGDLVQKTEAELLKLTHLGRRSLYDIAQLLEELNREIFADKENRYRNQDKSLPEKSFSLLTLGMKIPEWNKETVEDLIKKK